MSLSSLGEEQMHAHTTNYFSHATHVGHDLNKSYRCNTGPSTVQFKKLYQALCSVGNSGVCMSVNQT